MTSKKIRMIKNIFRYGFLTILSIILTTSCGTQKSSGKLLYDPKEVAELSDKLGIHLSNLNKNDDHNIPLYAETSLWLGVPYRYGGLSKKGVDCSGFAYLMYQRVYRMKIPRTTADLSKMKMKTISKNELRAGDLLFFTTSKSHNRINHVGIYLKEGRFIHASTSKGVTVNDLNDAYYKKTWKKSGRIR